MEIIEYTVTEPHGTAALCRGTVTDLILDSHLIPRCGLIPPFRVVAGVFRFADSQGGGMSPGCEWKSFELSEDDYWEAVSQLEQLSPGDLRSRHRDPHIHGEIQIDHKAPETDDYGVWEQSLVHRGLLPGGITRA